MWLLLSITPLALAIAWGVWAWWLIGVQSVDDTER